MRAFFRKFFDAAFLKFILVGVVNTLVGTGVMFVMYNGLHASYWLSSASNYIIGSIVSYFLNKHFTFQDQHKGVKTVLRFALNITVCYLIAYGAARPFVRWLFRNAAVNVRDNLALLCGAGLFILLNYFGQRLLVFRTDREGSGQTTKH